MVEHDFATFEGERTAHKEQRVANGTYAISQAFFYAADLWVDKPPLVSAQALDYAQQRWGDQADKVWTLKRAEIPRLDGCKISESGLIYEHVTTGGMFRKFIQTMLSDRSGVLDPLAVASWIHVNFQTAWVTRAEDRTLTSQGYRSRRGETLVEARAAYEKCGIVISQRPADSPVVVLVGDTSLEDEVRGDDVFVDEANNEDAPHELANVGGNYAQFFMALAEALKARKSRVSLGHGRDRPYAAVKGFDAPGAKAVLLLDAPRGANVRTPVLSLEAVTAQPGVEPATDGWAGLRDTLFGPEWRISYGSHKGVANALCRCKRSLAHAFEIADPSARSEGAERTAAEIDVQWTVLRG